MINYKELYEILGFNNITSVSPEEVVLEALGHLNYTEVEKGEAISFLKSQGWMGGAQKPVTEPAMPVKAAVYSPAAVPVEPVVDAVPAEAAEPVANESLPVVDAVPAEKKKGSLGIVLGGLIVIVLIVAGGLMYAYTQKIGPFSGIRYTEADFLPKLLEKSNQIDQASYAVSLDMSVADRDQGAKPFALEETSNAAQIRRQYENDSARIDDVKGIIRRLNELADYDSYDYKYDSTKGTAAAKEPSYPESIAGIFDNIKDDGENYNYYYYEDASVKDPATGKVYEYRTTDGGKNFQLTVKFETSEAVKAAQGYDYYDKESAEDKESKATAVSGKSVTFSRDSSEYIYMTGEPPKPFFESLSDALRMMSPDTRLSGSVSAATKFNTDTLPDWKFNFNAEGDFGDLSYKANADALKKGDDYYVKINNFPSLFFFDIGPFKGKWIRISPDELSKDNSDSYSMFSSLKENMADAEKKFKENREKSVKFTKKAIEIANEEKLVLFKNKPQTEKVDGRQLVRYDLKINKDAILPFYSKMQETIDGDPELSDYSDAIDQGFIDYLKSDEFDQVFAYFEDNNNFVCWTDEKGYPAAFENTLRVVPPDTATQLADKQINIVIGWNIDDINKEIVIDAPKDSVPIDKAIDDYEKNLDISKANGSPVPSENNALSQDNKLMKLIGSLRANIGSFWK